MSLPAETLVAALAAAVRLDAARDRAGAISLLDAALESTENEAGATRFKALLLRAEFAVDTGDLIDARGWLAQARQIRLGAAGREGLSSELRRADDLEAFLTHRGCAG